MSGAAVRDFPWRRRRFRTRENGKKGKLRLVTFDAYG
jgi:hypothetical protein